MLEKARISFRNLIWVKRAENFFNFDGEKFDIVNFHISLKEKRIFS